MAFAASVIRTVSGLEVEVMHAYARIVEGTDPEALHDLRVAARRLRSLLKPLRLGALAEDLDRAAKALGQATNPIRDMEVMAAELERHGLLIPASLRRQAVLRWYRQAGSSPQIKDLLDALDAWPDGVRRAMTEGRLDESRGGGEQANQAPVAQAAGGARRSRTRSSRHPPVGEARTLFAGGLPGPLPSAEKGARHAENATDHAGGLARPPAMVPQGRRAGRPAPPERGMAQVRGRRPGPGRGIRSAPCQVAGESHRPHLSGSATWPGGLSGGWANRAARGGASIRSRSLRRYSRPSRSVWKGMR
ncbi:TPA: CHAD domain-containing protein [Pseudomonas aeruginosa]|nr:CHAD domain-containing protein [Pseudomonas aeruginosa]